MTYHVRVAFDDACASVVDSRTYYATLDIYRAVGIGHEKTGNSSMFISSDQPMNRKELAKSLKGIKILSICKI